MQTQLSSGGRRVEQALLAVGKISTPASEGDCFLFCCCGMVFVAGLRLTLASGEDQGSVFLGAVLGRAQEGLVSVLLRR